METSWLELLVAALSGGLISQIFDHFITIYIRDNIQYERDFKKWRRNERYQVYSEFVDLTSSSKPEDGIGKWPGNIRSLSQRVYLLHENGRPPQSLCDAMENMFKLSMNIRDLKKEGKEVDEEMKEEIRSKGSKLRRELAKSLEDND